MLEKTKVLHELAHMLIGEERILHARNRSDLTLITVHTVGRENGVKFTTKQLSGNRLWVKRIKMPTEARGIKKEESEVICDRERLRITRAVEAFVDDKILSLSVGDEFTFDPRLPFEVIRSHVVNVMKIINAKIEVNYCPDFSGSASIKRVG